jgi:transketolase
MVRKVFNVSLLFSNRYKMSKSKSLQKICTNLRLRILDITHRTGHKGAHVGGALSIVELLAVLYLDVLKFDIARPHWPSRDRFILSKGHSALGLFAVLESVGFIEKAALDRFETNGSQFYAHAHRELEKGIEFSGGSLSLGISFAVGVALSCKRDNLGNHIYVLVGDGECDEGLVWEALMSASQFGLNNLTVIVDANGCQSDGYADEIMDKSNLEGRFDAFGFHVATIDGHNCQKFYNAIASRSTSKPNAIIANTTKGKGVSFMENNPDWHHGSLSIDQYQQARLELSI